MIMCIKTCNSLVNRPVFKKATVSKNRMPEVYNLFEFSHIEKKISRAMALMKWAIH